MGKEKQKAVDQGPAKDPKETEKERENALKIQKALEALTMQKKVESKESKQDHQFWSTQPVMDYKEDTDQDGPLEPDKTPEEIRKTPYALPNGFEWCEVDLANEKELIELYDLLNMNYVEDGDSMFRFDYSKDFLRWALQPPHWRQSWLIAVRVSSTQKLVGFISAIPAHIKVHSHKQFMVEVNFLCVHKKLRSKRLAPVLIKEITRRVHLTGCFQAAYTAGIQIPKPIAACKYFHRSLNPKKLIETGFSHLGKNTTLAKLIKKYALPEKFEVPGFRELKESDIPSMLPLLTKHLERFNLTQVFSEEEAKHWFLPKDGVVYSYVVEDPVTNSITDFASFYSLPSTVINHPVHKVLNVAYLFYYFHTKTDLKALIKDCLIAGKKKDFDVFNCLELMENKVFIEDLLFGPGDGTLHYYLYNWKCKAVEQPDVGLVLL